MEISIDFTSPNVQFWKEYNLLWLNSTMRSPFQSPHILQYFAATLNNGVIALQARQNKRLIGAAVFQKHNGVHSFLSDMKTDANFFVLSSNCRSNDIRQIFRQFLHIVKQNHWTFMLNNQPAWADYMNAFEEIGSASGLYWQNIPYSVCPVNTDDEAGNLFKRINNLREFRYPVNRLKNQENARFEVIHDDTDLELWVEEYCKAHILRWANTSTPSQFGDPNRQLFLKNCLRAWNSDHILVRFSIHVSMGRIGFAIGLLEENALIFHGTTFHPKYKKFSPGKAVIHFVAEWMAGQNIRILDFGDGDEAYKYDVAEKENQLNRIFISHPLNLSFILKTQAIKFVRSNPDIYNLYKGKVKQFRDKVFRTFAPQ